MAGFSELVPRRGLEPPRFYPLVPETSASTNSATWASLQFLETLWKAFAFQERQGFYYQKLQEHKPSAKQLADGRSRGHGSRPSRRARLPDARRRPVRRLSVVPGNAHGDARRSPARAHRPARQTRPARRARARDPRAPQEAHHRPPAAGIGIWLVAPEDKRYGQDILIPKNAIANATAGQIVAVELTEPPSLYSQPVGRVTEVLGEIDDPGMEIEIAVRKYGVPHAFSAETLAQAAKLPDKVRAADMKKPHRPARRRAGHDRWRRCARLRRRRLLRSRTSRAAARRRSRAGACWSRSPTSAITSSRASRWTATRMSARPRSTSRAA
ncbi:ribonuclease R [Ditylenchus destructor]|nr:ribonuclease R [Ditylenchus destructor]